MSALVFAAVFVQQLGWNRSVRGAFSLLQATAKGLQEVDQRLDLLLAGVSWIR